MPDDLRGGRAAVKHLVAAGHRRIGMIGGTPRLLSARQRRQGYEAAHHAAGLPVAPELYVDGDYSYHIALDAARQLFSLAEPPTAILAGNAPVINPGGSDQGHREQQRIAESSQHEPKSPQLPHSCKGQSCVLKCLPLERNEEISMLMVMRSEFTYWEDGDFFVGYLNEFPDYWTQGVDLDDLKEHLVDLYKDLTSGDLPGIRRVGELEVA